MKVVIAQGREDRNTFFAPNAGLIVPGLPVVGVVAVVDNVASEADESGIGIGDGAHQSEAYRRIRRFGVFRIMETSISIGDKANRGTHFDLQLYRGRGALRAWLLLAADQCEQTHDEPPQQQVAREGR